MRLIDRGDAVSICAAVMTGQGMGAIATVQLFGDSAPDVLQKVFRRRGDKPFELAEGRVLLGDIVEGGEILDEVTVGCEGPDIFAIHCHGNPLLVARIMGLLQRQGVKVIPAEQLLARIGARHKTLDSIGIEAKLALTTVKTLEGAAILAHQVKGGLSEKARQWRDRLDSISLEEIAAEAGDILKRSKPARLIISGCTIALVGPPSTGKSTLLNTLAGREKAIVSDLRGTTRDWVSAEIHLPPLAATIIDTAGLDGGAGASSAIDQAAQQKSIEITKQADLVLLVLDLSQPAEPLPESVATQLVRRRVVTVLNKADLPSCLDVACLPGISGPVVQMSAQQGGGIDELIRAIHRVCGVADFDPHPPVVFTDRQLRRLESLRHVGSKAQARLILSELLENSLPV
jgi:tRNA modification GTPase